MAEFENILKYVDRRLQYLGNRWLEAVLPYEAEITRTLNLFADEESRNLYKREIAFCILSNFLKDDLASSLTGGWTHNRFRKELAKVTENNIHPEIIAPPDSDWPVLYSKGTTFVLEQYRYKDKVKVESGDVCLDIGAYIGDTAIWMLENGAKAVYAFEIDKNNIECMQKTISNTPAYRGIKIVNNAVASKNECLYFQPGSTNNNAGKVLSYPPQGGDYYEVNSITLDDFCARSHVVPNFIKMDIEGAETMAITGARNTLQTHRPKVAICIYHAWEHRWEIPLMLAEMLPDYDFYLKKSDVFCETVFFGKGRVK